MFRDLPRSLRLTLLSCDGILLLTNGVFDQVVSSGGPFPAIDCALSLHTATADVIWPLLLARYYAGTLHEWHLAFEPPVPSMTQTGVLQCVRREETANGTRLTFRIGYTT